ncbi:hypothetical protein Patl1_15030 [Pistacia atlantica]|uniref:Uncharacterized protein n=1 Tax=Pistacia atlantica TaxID=434234 RepID=A0ACC1B8E7_9ROSI|nr:hypothetical protein Patl1_15030 [Pistacia atlantica]
MNVKNNFRKWKHVPLFNVSSILQNNTVTLHDPEYLLPFDNRSCGSFKNLTFPITPFLSFEIHNNQTIFKCPLSQYKPTDFHHVCNYSRDSFFYYHSRFIKLPSFIPQCSRIRFLLNKTHSSTEIFNLSTFQFDLEVKVTKECFDCHLEEGQCETDSQAKVKCSGKRERECVYCNMAGRSCRRNRYSYSDVKKMTNSFGHKLGQGGYGGVYKGRLPDGRYVAVKNLIDSKGNGEEFINEVASISRTSHVNIVTLLGFCFEGRTRALIYEFMSNGSLDKFIDEKNPLKVAHQLKWRTLYQIVVGIARGLEYLHRGCNIRILHFDIKPHNILLDENFCPKISDFGLAKICPQKESIVSMTGARGTIGYIAPEVFSRNFGVVSYKSDVYSYGMMVIEMTGGRQNNNVRVDNSSELYFLQWIYERLEVGEELGLLGISNEEDKECVRKMIIVSLWCIQTNPSDRPTMSRAVEMLEGSINSLQIPPKPFLSPGSAQETLQLTVK